MADFWIAVGALSESLVRRWVEMTGERPRVVKLLSSEGRGALEGSVIESSSGLDFEGWDVEEGLKLKIEETTSLEVVGKNLVWVLGL